MNVKLDADGSRIYYDGLELFDYTQLPYRTSVSIYLCDSSNAFLVLGSVRLVSLDEQSIILQVQR